MKEGGDSEEEVVRVGAMGRGEGEGRVGRAFLGTKVGSAVDVASAIFSMQRIYYNSSLVRSPKEVGEEESQGPTCVGEPKEYKGGETFEGEPGDGSESENPRFKG